MKRCLQYICDPEKTDQAILITGNAGSDPEFIFGEMMANKEFWNKEDGSQGFHYVLSFHPDEQVNPELALQIGEEFCEQLLEGHYIWVAASHTDKRHCHVHICFDSVSWVSGRKFHSGKHDWIARIQPITDDICRKHGLSTLSYDYDQERTGMYHQEWEDYQRRGQIHEDVSWTELIRDDVDQCVVESTGWEDFLSRMQDLHYTVRDGKYLSLQPEGRKTAMRSVRLGPEYSKESLLHRIKTQTTIDLKRKGRIYKAYGDVKKVYRAAVPYVYSAQGFSPVQKRFFKKLLRLRHFRNPKLTTPWKYRNQVVQIGRLTEITNYLFLNDITTMEEVAERLQQINRKRGRSASEERKLLHAIVCEYENVNDPEDILQASGAYDVPLPSQQDIHQIRINQILFGEGTDLAAETFTVRIPGEENYVRLYSDDSRIYNQGDTISTYVYAEADYQLESAEGIITGHITGKVLKGYFKSRKLEHHQQEDIWIKK